MNPKHSFIFTKVHFIKPCNVLLYLHSVKNNGKNEEKFVEKLRKKLQKNMGKNCEKNNNFGKCENIKINLMFSA